MKTIGSLLFILILSGFSAPRCGATLYYSDGSEANVQAIHDNWAHDGDIIVLPAGRFSWTTTLKITKGITLQGATTVSNAGTAAATANDLSVIVDELPRTIASGIIAVSLYTQSF